VSGSRTRTRTVAYRLTLRVGQWLPALVLVMACGEQANQPPSAGSHPREAATESSRIVPGAQLFAVACAGCHRIEAGGGHDVGPNLYGIIGQQAGKQADFAYSPALAASSLVWNRATLTGWVSAPESMLPGTSMSYANILTADEVDRLIDDLMTAASRPESE